MTGMLASVMSVAEAKMLLRQGPDIIDIKDPKQGALGALSIPDIVDIAEMVNGHVITSATIGDLGQDNPALLERIYAIAATGVYFVKVGMFGQSPSHHFIKTIATANKDVRLIIVLFAEDFIGLSSYQPFLEMNIKGIMIDTRKKTEKNLCEIVSMPILQEFVHRVKKAHLLTGLAGSLRFGDIVTLLGLKPDYLGFRGALCKKNNRSSQLDLSSIKKIRAAIPHLEKKRVRRVIGNGAMA